MRVAFRVDASRQMGIGHLRRSLSLAEALRLADAEVIFVTRDLGIESGAMIGDARFPHHRLPAPAGGFVGDPAVPHAAWAGVDADEDAAQTAACLDGGADWVIVDHYGFGARWHRAVRAALGCRIASIDDMADRDFDSDLLIDHNYARDHRAKYAGRLPETTPILGGPAHALLGPAFADAPRYAFSETVRTMGVFMGGVDAANASCLVLEAIEAAGFGGPVEVVSTSANPHLAALREMIGRRPGASLSLDVPDLAGFFARHDLQIGAGGGASWERCCIGVPTLLLVVAENQRAVVPDLARDRIVASVDSLAREEIALAIGALVSDSSHRAELAQRSRALVDGKGARRVARRLLCSG